MKSVEFLRINDVSPDDAASVDKHFTGYAENERSEESDYFDYSLVHMLSSQEWMTAEEVVFATKEYNEQYPDSTWNDDPGYIALSLIKMVECGLANLRIKI